MSSTFSSRAKWKEYQEISQQFSTFHEYLEHLSHHVEPNKHIFTFVDEYGNEQGKLTNTELISLSKGIANNLMSVPASESVESTIHRFQIQPRETVLLLCNPGADFVKAFFGCLFANVIPVPCYPPLEEKHFEKLFHIARECNAKSIILSTDFFSMMREAFEEMENRVGLGKLNWISLNSLLSEPSSPLQKFDYSQLKRSDVMFLQFSSGSTSEPKGIQVTHGNILHHTFSILHVFDYKEEDKDKSVVIWLPPFHDMGLIGGLFTAMSGSLHVVLMTPLAFIRSPLVWLQCISKYNAICTGGPNFALEYTCSRVTDEQIKSLNLSSLQILFCGAEPIRHSTLQKFASKFEAAGFQSKAFLPCYGLAEATLLVSSRQRFCGYKTVCVDKKEFLNGKIVISSKEDENSKVIVSCGSSDNAQEFLIVNTENFSHSSKFTIGEVWIKKSPHITNGYLNKPELNSSVFYAQLANGNTNDTYMRTGDLGFVDEANELYICGRIKDVIIVRGRNYYAIDLEESIEQLSSTILRKGCCIALETNDHSVCLVAEVKKEFEKLKDFSELDALAGEMSKTILKHHGISLDGVYFIKAGTIPKTTSGKLRRFECKNLVEQNSLPVVCKVIVKKSDPLAVSLNQKQKQEQKQATSVELNQLLAILSQLLEIPAENINIDEPLMNFGMDSLKLNLLLDQISKQFNIVLSPAILFKYPTISDLVNYFSNTDTTQESQQLQSENKSVEKEEIAVIGLACRFPGCDNKEQFWKILSEGTCPLQQQHHKVGSIEGKFQFDNELFGFREEDQIELMDPQQKIMLEIVMETLEDASISIDTLANSNTGIFLGVSTNDHALLSGNHSNINPTYIANSMIANRVSYWYNWKGPSMVIDTACSSSLVAIHLACQSLHNSECSMAVAGGINLCLSDAITTSLEDRGFLSKDHLCKFADKNANGYVRSEGVGTVLLKPLSLALKDGNHIYAVIKGSATGQDGKSNGITAPNPLAQEHVIRKALSNAHLSANDLQFVECHGSATAWGDVVECSALKQVFGNHSIQIGSVKSNIGHCEAAAGVAGFIKTVLQLKHKLLVPSLHVAELNPFIDFSTLQLTQKVNPLEEKVRAGVSSFGFGGALAHVILESFSAPLTSKEAEAIKEYPILLSAPSSKALRRQVNRLVEYVKKNQSSISIRSLSNYLYFCKSKFAFRCCLFASTSEELLDKAHQYLHHNSNSIISTSIHKPISNNSKQFIFVYAGNGVDFTTNCQSFLQFPIFTFSLNQCYQHFVSLLPTLSSFLNYLQTPSTIPWNDIRIVHPLQFAYQYALTQFLKTHLHLDNLGSVGHSFGEIMAAVSLNWINLEDACQLVYLRSQILYETCYNKGKMCIVRMSATQFETQFKNQNQVIIAAINSPESITLTGTHQGMEQVMQQLEQARISFKQLQLAYPFHFKPCFSETDFDKLLSNRFTHTTNQAGKFLFSSVIKETLTNNSKCIDMNYWKENITQCVQFEDAIQRCMQQFPQSIFIEVSSRSILQSMIHQTAKQSLQRVYYIQNNSKLGIDLIVQLVSNHQLQWSELQFLFDAKQDCHKLYLPYEWNHDKLFVPSYLQSSLKESDLQMMDQLCWSLLHQSMQSISFDQITPKYQTTLYHRYQHLLSVKQNQLIIEEPLVMIQHKMEENPLWKPDLQLVYQCGLHLKPIIQGKVNPLHVLFPNGNGELVETFYENSLVFQHCHQQLCNALLHFLKLSKRQISVLEVGAGTASTTRQILPILKDSCYRYVVTDVSSLLLQFAKKKLTSSIPLEYQVLDIEKEVTDESLLHQFDLIIASNVLHATSNLDHTIRNLKQLVRKSGGMVIGLEVTNQTHTFADVTFGLLDGWWKFDDFRKRNGYPLLTEEEWKNCFARNGLEQFQVWKDNSNSTLQYQSILMASFVNTSEKEVEIVQPVYIKQEIKKSKQQFDLHILQQVKQKLTESQQLDPSQSRQVLESAICQLLSERLELSLLPEKDAHVPLQQMGVDSLMALEIRNVVYEVLDVKLPLEILSDSLTVSQLSQLLLDQFVAPSTSPSASLLPVTSTPTIIPDRANAACHILGLGVATPAYRYTQEEMTELATFFYQIQGTEMEQKLRKIFTNSGITTRYSVMDLHSITDPKERFGTFAKRNQVYEDEATNLAYQSATHALQHWGGPLSSITHVVSVSTTGNKIPGIEFELVQRLGLSPKVQRVSVNGMGCFGFLPGLKTATSFAQMNPKNRVLLVSTEICSNHVEEELTIENFVSSAIFADGSSAAVIGVPDTTEKCYFEIQNFESLAIDNSLDKMYWKVTDKGYRLGLSKDIPHLIFENLDSYMNDLLSHSLQKEHIYYAIHPGGKAILLAIETGLQIKKEQTIHSWKVMQERGNCSSSTIGYVLHRIINQPKEELQEFVQKFPYTCSIVFGPGLTIEGCILKNVFQ